MLHFHGTNKVVFYYNMLERLAREEHLSIFGLIASYKENKVL
jgi:hypothetical protein